MEQQLIPNEEKQELQEPQQQQQAPHQAPPTYSPGQVPMPSFAVPSGQQVMYAPQQGYVIQNIPVAHEEGCCGGRSKLFRSTLGVVTGITQIVLAVVALSLSVASIVLQPDEDYWYPYMGAPIASAVVFFIPAGILGACTKKRSSCVIVAYLVMSILSAIDAFFNTAVEGNAAAFHSTGTYCPDFIDYTLSEGSYDRPDMAYACEYRRYVGLTVIHSLTAFVTFAEFIVAVVAAAYCCGGLSCCCAGQAQNQAQRSGVPMIYGPSPIGGMQATPTRVLSQVEQGTEPTVIKS